MLRYYQKSFVKKLFSTSLSKEGEAIRNIGIIAHIDAGKTTTTERILAMVGITKRPGNVDNGDTVMDFLEEERDRGITIQSASITFSYNNTLINLIDTPGHVDFGSEVDSSLRVLDAAILLIDSSAGVQAQTLRVFQQAKENKLPLLIFINKLDKVGSSIPKSLSSIVKNLSSSIVPIQVVHNNHQNIIDLLSNETLDDHKQMLENLSMFDDEILHLYTSSQNIPLSLLKTVIRKLTIERRIYPVLFGSSIKGLGIKQLMDSVIDYLPSPTSNDTKDDAIIFKTILDPHSGPLAHTRIFSPPLSQGMFVWNKRNAKSYRIQSLHSIMADSYEKVDKVGPNRIVLIKGLKDFKSGDSLSIKKLENPTITHDFNPKDQSVLSMSVIVDDESDEKKLKEDLEKIAFEDPSIKISLNMETGRHLISGMGELHLEIASKRITVPVTFGPLRLEIKELLMDDIYDFTYWEGNSSLKFSIKSFCPLEATSKEAALKIIQNPPDLHANIVRDSIILSLDQGILDGYPIINVLEVKIDIKCDNSGEQELRNLTLRGMNSLLLNCSLKIGDPLMRVEVRIPSINSGPIIKRIHSIMEGEIENLLEGGGDGSVDHMDDEPISIIQAKIPLKNLLGFSKILRGLTSGLGSFSMEPIGYKAR